MTGMPARYFSGLLLLLFLLPAFTRDTDGDGISDDKDSCPFDSKNDGDGDNMCAVDKCRDDPEFEDSLYGLKCDHFAVGKKGHGQCKEHSSIGFDDVCSACSCTCAHEAACNFDPCPADAENDFDKDGICGDLDSCPLDKDNDADSDRICGDIDTCITDSENDSDSDQICGDIDSCPRDSANDADNDSICGDEDTCPFDALDDIDSDNLCGDVDTCPTDQENDKDGDKICDAAQCVDSTDFTSVTGYTCAEYASESGFCESDSTAELNVCASCSCACAHEPACGGSVDVCPDDPDNDADSDNLCGNVDPCPLDKENDADNDNLCADKDVCPKDSSNDVDSDSICGQVDSCPMDRENDADADDLCGDNDKCPHDAENDSDNDMLCADADPCPHDFREPVDGRCNEARLPFSQLDSLQALRKALPAATPTEDCPWSDVEKAAQFGLESIECMRALQGFQMDIAGKTLSGSITITAGVNWNTDRQEQLAKYIASVARMPSKISLSPGGHTFHVIINVDRLPFRPLRCSDPDACNFNEDVTAQFINSDKTANECCDYACHSTDTSPSTSPISNAQHEPLIETGRAYGNSPRIAADVFVETDCTVYYMYMGIGIGIGGAIVVTLIGTAISCYVLRTMGYRLRRKKPEKGPNGMDGIPRSPPANMLSSTIANPGIANPGYNPGNQALQAVSV